MFADVRVKDYKIDLDGKPCIIKGERWLGVINRDKEDCYFEGAVFDKRNNGCYEMGGEVTKTKAEFEAELESVTYFK